MLVALAILGVISVTFLHGLSIATDGVAISDERETAKNIAESQMEYVKSQDYADSYAIAPIPSEYTDYSVDIIVSTIESRDGNIQNVAVLVKHQNEQVLCLESYKMI